MKEVTLTDGRVVGVEAAAPHEAMALAQNCGELSANRRWWKTAMLMLSVRSIDGVPMPPPLFKKHIEGLCSRFPLEADVEAIRSASSVPVDVGTRAFEFARLTTFEDLRISELARECSEIPGWIGPAMLAAMVRKIDGVDVELPASQDDLLARVKELGVDGMMQAAIFHMGDEAAKQREVAAVKAAAKN